MTGKKMLVDQFAEFSSAVVRALPRDMDVETAQTWIMDQVGLKSVLAAALLPRPNADGPVERPVLTPVIHFTPVLDDGVPEAHQATLGKYRLVANEHDAPATVPVYCRVRTGFTLKVHAPKAGPCFKNFEYLQDWNFPDEATLDCGVFWVPRVLKGSLDKTVGQQRQLLDDLRTRLELPAHHMSGFGKVALVAGLILAHHKATQERIPENRLWVRTDTCRADGDRLGLGDFDDTGLRCDWYGGVGASGDVGVLALGVEVLGD